jgi:threonine/homoserine/homoserine lactone efflux protein
MLLTYFASNIISGAILRAIYIAGGIYMTLLAVLIAISTPKRANNEGGDRSMNTLISYSTSLALGLTNPYQILWWLSAGLSFFTIFGLAAIAGLFMAILVWITIFPLLVRAGYYYGGKIAIIAIKAFSVSILIAFATIIIYEGLVYPH